VRLLEYATARQARVLGKPSADFFRLAVDAAGVPPDRAVMVGDDRSADIAGAHHAGIRAVLVRTGKSADPHPQPPPARPTGPETGAAAADATQPDRTIDGLAELPGLLR
jgi:ribonucleotide monophosphatase NagD (HAD superfamily)